MGKEGGPKRGADAWPDQGQIGASSGPDSAALCRVRAKSAPAFFCYLG